ncbi:hypothetical protein GGI00_006111, partial [Coemansia sp. RSA 2681]
LSTSSNWAKRLMPTNDVERAQMQIIVVSSAADEDLAAAGAGASDDDDVLHTVLGHQASELVDATVQNAIAYAQAVTERGLVSSRLAFTWSIEHSREADYTPSLATLVAFVRRSLAQLERSRAVRAEKLRLARNSAAEMSTAELRKLVNESVYCDLSADLSVQQMRELAAVLLTREAQTIAVSIVALVEAVEQALVLLWRHLSFFIGGSTSSSSPDLSSSLSSRNATTGQSMLHLSQQEREILRSDASIALPPLLAQLSDLKLEQDVFATSANTHMSFIQMLVRRTKDLVLRDVVSI